MSAFLSFLIIISFGLFFSRVFGRFHLPYVTALIIAGMVTGPYALGLFEIDPAISMIGIIGAIFLMFMAGLETHIKHFKDIKAPTWYLFSLNSIVPFLTGFAIGMLLNFSEITSVILGILFMSSSVAVLLPQLEKTGLLKKKLGKTILTSVIFADIISLLLLASMLQLRLPRTPIPLPAYFFIILISILIMKFAFPKARQVYLQMFGKRDSYEGQLRFIIILLIGTAIFFESLGMHSIIAGFIVGMVLSETIKHEEIINKLRVIAYGVFIPTFFVIVGAGIDLSIFATSKTSILIVGAIVIGLILSKTISGYIAGRLGKFTSRESLIIGVSTTPQLSTTIAAAFIAQQSGLLNPEIITSLIILSIITTLFTPLILDRLIKKLKI